MIEAVKTGIERGRALGAVVLFAAFVMAGVRPGLASEKALPVPHCPPQSGDRGNVLICLSLSMCWLGDLDSNQDYTGQSRVFYR